MVKLMKVMQRGKFKKLKQKVNNDKLKHDLVKYLEKSLFGEDIKSIEPEEKYEESIAERVKKQKREDTQKTLLHQVHQKWIILKQLLII